MSKKKEKTLPFVSIIIPTYRDSLNLINCLKAIRQQSYPQNNYEVIVVDNDNREDEDISIKYRNCRVVKETKKGSYAARNAGIKQSRGEILFFTDADCIPDNRWIEKGILYMQNNPDIGFAGGKIDLFFRGNKLTITEIYEKTFGFRQEEILYGRKHSVTANLIAQRNSFHTTGLFNDSMLSTGDIEWCHRALNKGLKIGYCEDAIVTHPARYSMGQLLRKKIRVSGGQFEYNKSIVHRTLIVLGGFLPPVIPIKKHLDRNDLCASEKIVSFVIIYLVRVLRSYVFLFLGLNLLKPKRT